MRVVDIQRHGAPLDIDSAWNFHCATRERTHPRTGIDIIRKKTELQKTLEAYREAVETDFDTGLKNIPPPAVFGKNTDEFFVHAQRTPHLADNDRERDRRWHYELEMMRAQELKKHFDFALKDLTWPSPSQDSTLKITDVGSRSGYFSTLMNHQTARQTPRQIWTAADIRDPKGTLPSAVAPREGRFKQIVPFGEIPKSDIITLNCVLHHVGEREDRPGTFDESKLDQFIGTAKNALPKDGLVVVVEDFIGKENEQAPYRDFVKDLDALFYPNSLGNQKPSEEWIKKFEDQGFKLEKEEYPIGFNVVGFPVVETLLVFRKK